MTDRGRGSGSDPWYAHDPLFGDPEWGGQPTAGEWGHDQTQAAQWNGGHGAAPGDPYGHGGTYGQDAGHGQNGGYNQDGGYGQDGTYGQGDPHGQGYAQGPPQRGGPQGHGEPYPGQQYHDPYQQQPGHQGYGHDQYAQPDPYGQQPDPYYGGRQPDPYGQTPYGEPDPYAQQPGHQGGQDGYQGGQDGYPFTDPHQDPHQQPPQHPDPRHQDPFAGAEPYDPYGHAEPEPHHAGQPEQEPDAGQRPRPSRQGDDHPFFADDDGSESDDGDAEPGRGERRRGKQQKRKPRRSGVACLFVLVVLGGGLYGAGHFGYQFWQDHFGPAPDYSGDGEGSIQIEVPQGASSSDIARILLADGVVKSTAAFVDAASHNPDKARAIQPGVYSMKKHMSATAAFDALTDTANLNNLTIPEGWRATRIYAAIDQRLHLKPGTTAKQAKNADLGLPSWAHGKVDGFLFPSRYSVGKQTKPVELLREMVKQAEKEYHDDGLLDSAKVVHKSPYQVLVLASIVQAEAQESKDFSKVARVLYNRLDSQDTNGLLQMDSTVNYALGRSTLNVTQNDTRFPSPYNTYLHKGLPPGPIDSPGNEAIAAALHPAKGDWLYFVTVKPGDTRFTASAAEHAKNVADFNKYQREHGGG
jgi:uncharacterized YceG family protein